MISILGAMLVSSVLLTSPENEIIEYQNTIIEQLDEPGKTLFSDDEFKEEFFKVCEEYDKDPELIISMMKSESTYNPDADNGTCIGLMQINPKWHKDRMERLNVTDLKDPISNVKVGVDYLSELSENRSIKYALMCYNMGFTTAKEYLSKKGYSYYANSIVEYAETLKED